MKKETIDSVARVTEEVVLDVVGGIAGTIGEYLIAPIYMGVTKYDFLWKHPNTSKEAKELRVRQESEILLAKLRHNGYVEIRNIEPSRIYYSRRSFAVYLEDLLERMIANGAMAEEIKPVADMCHEYGCSRKSTISVNNLRWIHKMENKYGVEERSIDE